MLLYPSAIPLSTTHLRHVADLLRGHLRRIGSPWRKLDPDRQALLVLAHLRNGDTYARLATGFGIGVATVYRCVREVTDLLAAQAPTLTAAARRHHITHTCQQADLLLLADTGYHNITDTITTLTTPGITPNVITPYKNTRNRHIPKRELPEGRKAANRARAQFRGLGERGFATLKTWRILTRARASTHRVTTLAKAILTLEHHH